MKTIEKGGWVFHLGDISQLDESKVGKWMYFYHGEEGWEFAKKMCREAVEQKVVAEAKCSIIPFQGVSCYYLNIDDEEGHKKVIQYFLDHDMIQKTKTGRLHNISFKLDRQTAAGEYGSDFESELKLEQFLDLNTGEWIRA